MHWGKLDAKSEQIRTVSAEQKRKLSVCFQYAFVPPSIIEPTALDEKRNLLFVFISSVCERRVNCECELSREIVTSYTRCKFDTMRKVNPHGMSTTCFLHVVCFLPHPSLISLTGNPREKKNLIQDFRASYECFRERKFISHFLNRIAQCSAHCAMSGCISVSHSFISSLAANWMINCARRAPGETLIECSRSIETHLALYWFYPALSALMESSFSI